MKIKVLLADDHRVVREGIILILKNNPDISVVGEAGNGIDATAKALQLKPDVVIMDIGMPLLNGIEATRQIINQTPGTIVIILSMYGDDQTVLAALKAGAKGFIIKDEAGEEVIKAITYVLNDRFYLSPQISSALIDSIVKRDFPGCEEDTNTFSSLTPQERQILQLVAEGHSNKSIAKLLYISNNTVRSHRKHLMSKLDIHNTAGLTKFALEKGFIRLKEASDFISVK
jgi:DNA-binding NarL/FixJ family response regulator